MCAVTNWNLRISKTWILPIIIHMRNGGGREARNGRRGTESRQEFTITMSPQLTWRDFSLDWDCEAGGLVSMIFGFNHEMVFHCIKMQIQPWADSDIKSQTRLWSYSSRQYICENLMPSNYSRYVIIMKTTETRNINVPTIPIFNSTPSLVVCVWTVLDELLILLEDDDVVNVTCWVLSEVVFGLGDSDVCGFDNTSVNVVSMIVVNILPLTPVVVINVIIVVITVVGVSVVVAWVVVVVVKLLVWVVVTVVVDDEDVEFPGTVINEGYGGR